MFFTRLPFVIALVASSALGASQAIGIAVANGELQIDRTSVHGNTTLFDGSVIETGVVSSDLALSNGARVRLGAGSQAHVFSDRLVLDRGRTEIVASSGYAIEAVGLRVAPDTPQARLAVTCSGAERIQVAALVGSGRVSGSGVLIARVATGTALDLEPQASGAATPSKIVGVVESKDGAFVLADEATLVTYTLVGPDVAQYVGKRVEVLGSINAEEQTAGGTARAMRVLKIREIAKARKSGGMSLRSQAVIAGVSVAAAVGVVIGIEETRGSSKSTISGQ